MPRQHHLSSLDGLRFIAILIVFVQHLQGHFGIPNWGFRFGHEATTFFFVLSGFVLAYAYRDGFGQPGQLRTYFFSRWSRAWPLHALGLVVATVLLSNQPDFFARPDWPALAIANSVLLHSWVPLNAWLQSFNSVSWFLSVLAFGYLVFPFVQGSTKRVVISLAGSLLIQMACVLILGNLLSSQWDEVKQNLVMFHPLLRIADFLIGVGMGMIFVDQRSIPGSYDQRFRHDEEEHSATSEFVEGTDIGDLKIVTSSRVQTRRQLRPASTDLNSSDTAIEFVTVIIAIGYLVAMFFLDWDRQLANLPAIGSLNAIWIRSLSGTAIAVLVTWGFAGRQGGISQLLSSPPLLYLGSTTFAFYMTHQLLIRGLSQAGWNSQIPAAGIAFLIFLLCIAVAILTYHLFEIPVRALLLHLEKECNRDDVSDAVASSEAIAAVQEAGGRFLSGLKTPTSAISFALLILGAAAVYGSYAPPKHELQMDRQWVQRPLFGRAPIIFQEEAILHGLQAIKDDQGLHLTLVWERLLSAKRNRSFHLLDDNGNIIGYAAQDQDAYQQHPPGTTFTEELTIPATDLNEVATVGFGFFHPVHKGAIINRGPRGMNNRRLDIDLSIVP